MNKLSPVEKTLFEAREVAGSATYKKRESEFVSSFQVSLFTKRVNRSVKILFFFSSGKHFFRETPYWNFNNTHHVMGL